MICDREQRRDGVQAAYSLVQAETTSKGLGSEKTDSFFKHLEFKKCEMEYGVYVQHTSEGNIILVFLYVDDILLTWSCTSVINKFKKVLMNAFDMNDLGNMVYFLGMEILHSQKGINITN